MLGSKSAFCAITVALVGFLGIAQPVQAGGIGGRLELADEGMFFVGGSLIRSDFPGLSPAGPVASGSVMVNQMFVHYRIPARQTQPTPIILVPGGGLTGMSYETTPDGREGWATYLARQGFAVYVVDTPGRGRAGFDATAINKAKAEGSAAPLPANVLMITAEVAWTLFRFGPSYGKAFVDTQFPTQAFAQFTEQGVPLAETTLDGGGMATAPRALAALVDRIGPAVVVVHSLSGPFADALVELRPNLVKAVIDIEGTQAITPTDAQIAAYQGIPVLELFGDHLDSSAFTGRARYEARRVVVDRINQRDQGKASLIELPEQGIRGNSHIMMLDNNNLQVADFIVLWLGKNLH